MNNINYMVKSLEELKKAFKNVNTAWDQCSQMDNLKKSDYPFEDSFDELNIKVHNWIDESINELKEIE